MYTQIIINFFLSYIRMNGKNINFNKKNLKKPTFKIKEKNI